jgi:hypothetical protein
VVDSANCPVQASEVKRITLRDVPETMAFFGSEGCTGEVGLQFDLAAGDSARRLWLRDTAPGTPSVEARASVNGQLSVTLLDVTVRPGAPALLELTASQSRVQAASCLGPLVLEVKDAFANPVLPDAGVVVRLASSSDGGAFHTWLTDGGSCGAVLPEALLPFTGSRVQVGYRDTRAGTPELRAQLASRDAGVEHLVEVEAGAPAGVAFISPQPLLVALPGRCTEPVVFERQDAHGNPVPFTAGVLVHVAGGGSAPPALYTDPQCSSPAERLEVTGARGQVFLLSQTPGLTGGVEVVDSELDSVLLPFEVLTSDTPALTAHGASQVGAGECSGPLFLSAQLPDGGTVDLRGRQVVLGATSEGAVRYYGASDSACSAPLEGSASFPPAGGELALRYRQTRAGTTTLLFSAPASPGELVVAQGSHQVEVDAGPATALRIHTPTRNLWAGDCAPTLSITEADAYGNPLPLKVHREMALRQAQGERNPPFGLSGAQRSRSPTWISR